MFPIGFGFGLGRLGRWREAALGRTSLANWLPQTQVTHLHERQTTYLFIYLFISLSPTVPCFPLHQSSRNHIFSSFSTSAWRLDCFKPSVDLFSVFCTFAASVLLCHLLSLFSMSYFVPVFARFLIFCLLCSGCSKFMSWLLAFVYSVWTFGNWGLSIRKGVVRGNWGGNW